jgi:hypothetical protein
MPHAHDYSKAQIQTHGKQGEERASNCHLALGERQIERTEQSAQIANAYRTGLTPLCFNVILCFRSEGLYATPQTHVNAYVVRIGKRP